jgi:hypothetical protein
MELAIPLIALGGMYVIRNNKTLVKKESFTNMDSFANYENPVAKTDAYFPPRNDQKTRKESTNSFYLEDSKFQHNNMVPFSKPKGGAYSSNINETALDNMAGGGSQHIKKVEQAPLFKPEEHTQWSNGAPNQSDFYQSRVNPSIMKTNLKPFETERVGPGLNKGFKAEGSGGFNSGMDSRDQWMPKSVDELRVTTNPKLEYELTGHQGPAGSFIKNIGQVGRVEKQRPDTFYVNSQDRWFTTTGLEKGATQRAAQDAGNVRRSDVSTDFVGAATSHLKAGGAPEYYETSRRPQAREGSFHNISVVGRGPSNNDTIMKSHTVYENNRNKTNVGIQGGIRGAFGAVVAPIMDALRPSRKDENIHNMRISGELSTTVPKSYLVNDQVIPTTIKETTLHSPTFNVNAQKEGAYLNSRPKFDATQRETSHTNYSGGAVSKYGEMVHDSIYSHSDIKSSTIENRPNPGGMQLFNSNLNVSIAKNDLANYYVNAPVPLIKKAASKEIYGQMNSSARDPVDNNRNDGNLLSAFKENPYTHSLSSVA